MCTPRPPCPSIHVSGGGGTRQEEDDADEAGVMRLPRRTPLAFASLGLGLLFWLQMWHWQGELAPVRGSTPPSNRRGPTRTDGPPTASPPTRYGRTPLGYASLACMSTGTYLHASEVSKVYHNYFQVEHLLNAEASGRCCVQHRSVLFLPPVDVAKPPPVPPLCGLPALVSLLKKGGDAAEWVGDGPPAFRFKPHGYGDCAALLEAGSLDRRTLFSVLKGERIVFSGDSMVRQMYLRLIEMIRNDRPEKEDEFEYIEHYYHQDSYYAASAEKDVLLLSKSGNAKDYFPDPSAIQFELLFIWDPFPAKFSRAPFTTMKPTVVLASFMYWWKGRAPFSEVDEYVATAGAFLKEQPAAHLYYLTTPWTAKGTFGGVEDERRVPRNAYVEAKLAALRLPNAHVLDFAAFAGLGRFEKTPDAIHYQCIFRPVMPKAIKVKESKFKKSGCRDPVNRNWAVVLLSSLASRQRS